MLWVSAGHERLLHGNPPSVVASESDSTFGAPGPQSSEITALALRNGVHIGFRVEGLGV